MIGYARESTDLLMNQCEAFEDGEIVKFQNDDDWIQFARFYVNNYELNECRILYKADGYSVRMLDEGKYDRDEVVGDILELFSSVTGQSKEDTITNVCKVVTDTIEYNDDYTYSSLEEAINARQGVCWQYAKICATVLRDKGIPCEIIYGYAGSNIQTHNETHMWLKCNTGDKVVYVDPALGIMTDEYYRANYHEIDLNEWLDMVKTS
jgi:transglutaminase-like putative cysteine protease